MHSHGSPGPAADGLPLSEHQPVCGEFPQDGAQAARVRQTQPADLRDQLCEFPELFYKFKDSHALLFCSFETTRQRKPYT